MPRASVTAPAAMTRHLHRIDDLRNERERAGLRGDVVAQEDAAMAAGLVALRDHGIDAACFEPARLGGGGRRTHQQEASRLEPLQEPRLRQPEMEAHDVGLRLLDDIAHHGVERGAVARRDRRGGIDRELAVIGRQAFAPARLAGVVEHRRRMAEEIEIYGFLRAGANLRHLLADLIGIEHRAWERCERARLGRGHCELPIHGAGNRCLHDRKLDVEQLEEATVRPHIRTILRDLVPHLITLPFASHGRRLHHGHAHDMMV
jgi:hypothetical protein